MDRFPCAEPDPVASFEELQGRGEHRVGVFLPELLAPSPHASWSLRSPQLDRSHATYITVEYAVIR